MTDKKLLLRVSMKLMLLIGMGFFVYVLFAGLTGRENDGSVLPVAQFDISTLKPGDIKYFSVNNRKLLVLYRTEHVIDELQQFDSQLKDNKADQLDDRYRSVVPAYFVAYANDPFYGCQLELTEKFLKSVCVDVKYDFSGRVYKSARAEKNLIVPKYEIEAGKHIMLLAN